MLRTAIWENYLKQTNNASLNKAPSPYAHVAISRWDEVHIEENHVQRLTLHNFTTLQYYMYIYHSQYRAIWPELHKVLPTMLRVPSTHRPFARQNNFFSSVRLQQVLKCKEKCTIYSTEPFNRPVFLSCMCKLHVFRSSLIIFGIHTL